MNWKMWKITGTFDNFKTSKMVRFQEACSLVYLLIDISFIWFFLGIDHWNEKLMKLIIVLFESIRRKLRLVKSHLSFCRWVKIKLNLKDVRWKYWLVGSELWLILCYSCFSYRNAILEGFSNAILCYCWFGLVWIDTESNRKDTPLRTIQKRMAEGWGIRRVHRSLYAVKAYI